MARSISSLILPFALLCFSKLAFSAFGVNADYKYPFQNPSLSWEKRVDDLVGRLTLQEISAQTMAIYGKSTPAITRLGINPYVWITECIRGEVGTNTTAFPQPIGLAAAFR